MEKYKIGQTKVGKPAIFFNGFVFSQKKGREGRRVWTCTNRLCKAKIIIEAGSEYVSSTEGDHASACKKLSAREEQRCFLRSAMKRKVTEGVTCRPMKIARQELMSGTYNELRASDLYLARRSLYRERHKNVASIPSSQLDNTQYLKSASLKSNLSKMSSAGLGRGRGSGGSQRLLRNPGPASPDTEAPPLPPVSPEGKAKVDMLLVQVESLDLTDEGTDQQLRFIKEAFRAACTDGNTLSYAIEKLHQVCLKDHSMSGKVAASCNAAGALEVDGVKLRSVLLSCVQNDYGRWKELQASDPTRFLNTVVLLGEVFSRVHINDRPITILSGPVLEYLESLLSGDEPEMEIFTSMLAVNGAVLQETAETNLHNVLLKVRSTLMSRNLSSLCRLWLLFIIDLANNNFTPLPPRLHEYYKEELGISGGDLLDKLEISVKNSSDNTSSVPLASRTSASMTKGAGDEIINTSSMNVVPKNNMKLAERLPQAPGAKKAGSPVKSPTSSPVKSPAGSPSKTPASSHRSDGFGNRGDGDKRENFRNAFGVKTDGGEKGKGRKYWLHDDRFEKDDETYEKSRSREKDAGKPRASDGNWRQGSNHKPASEEKESFKKPLVSSHALPPKVEIPSEECWD